MHEAVQFSGFGAEIAATIAQSELLFELKGPIQRVGGLYCPIPFNATLEKESLPTPEKIIKAISKTGVKLKNKGK